MTYQDGVFPGECGTVMNYSYDGRLGVRWDSYLARRHGLGDTVTRGHGWYVPKQHVVYEGPNDLGEFAKAQESDIDSLFK